MTADYYSYKTDTFICRHCGWTGTGKKVKMGDWYDDGFEVDCPKCHEHFPGLIMFPMVDEVLEKGSKRDKLAAAKQKKSREKWLASILTNINQLPDLHSDLMTFVLREVKEGGENYIEITYNDEVVWKEIRVYEYYERFIKIGKLFQEKYGNKMIDIVPDVNGVYLYGDDSRADQIIEDFRKELRANLMTAGVL